MTSIQRYDAWPQEWPFEAEDGDLVTYEDHRKIVEELEAKLAKAVEALQSITFECVGDSGRCGSRAALAELSSTMKGQDDE
jgi:hypothetical protein